MFKAGTGGAVVEGKEARTTESATPTNAASAIGAPGAASSTSSAKAVRVAKAVGVAGATKEAARKAEAGTKEAAKASNSNRFGSRFLTDFAKGFGGGGQKKLCKFFQQGRCKF